MEQRNKPVVALFTGEGFAVVDMFREFFGDRAEICPVYLPTERFSYSALEDSFPRMYEQAEDAGMLHPDMVVYASQNGSCLKGEQVINFFEQRYGVPATASAQEMLHRLNREQLKNILVVSPFSAALNLIEKYYFEKNGIRIATIINTRGQLNEEVEGQSSLDQGLASDIREALTEDIEAIVFDSPTYRAEALAEKLREQFPVPVLTSNTALAEAVETALFHS